MNVESQRAVIAQETFGKWVKEGKRKAMAGAEAIQHEYQHRHDLMAKPSAIDARVNDKREMEIEIGGATYGITHHARNQLLAQAEIPSKFVDTLAKHDLNDLLRFNMQKLLPRTAPDGLLIREVDGTVKGVLSPAYRILDTSPMFEAFIQEAVASGLVPKSGEVTETRAFIEFLLPRVIEVLPGEHVVFGAQLRGSDYGNGALDLALSIWRLLCSNGAIGTSMFRKVHLGRRFDGFGEGGDGIVKLSRQTVELDSKTMQSALQDAMKSLPEQVEAQVEIVRQAADKSVDLSEVLNRLGKGGLKKATLEKVKALYETEQPVESLPQQPGAWRLSNVLSLLANSVQGDEAQDLRMTAYTLINAKAAPKSRGITWDEVKPTAEA